MENAYGNALNNAQKNAKVKAKCGNVVREHATKCINDETLSQAHKENALAWKYKREQDRENN